MASREPVGGNPDPPLWKQIFEYLESTPPGQGFGDFFSKGASRPERTDTPQDFSPAFQLNLPDTYGVPLTLGAMKANQVAEYPMVQTGMKIGDAMIGDYGVPDIDPLGMNIAGLGAFFSRKPGQLGFPFLAPGAMRNLLKNSSGELRFSQGARESRAASEAVLSHMEGSRATYAEALRSGAAEGEGAISTALRLSVDDPNLMGMSAVEDALEDYFRQNDEISRWLRKEDDLPFAPMEKAEDALTNIKIMSEGYKSGGLPAAPDILPEGIYHSAGEARAAYWKNLNPDEPEASQPVWDAFMDLAGKDKAVAPRLDFNDQFRQLGYEIPADMKHSSIMTPAGEMAGYEVSDKLVNAFTATENYTPAERTKVMSLYRWFVDQLPEWRSIK